MGFTASSSRGSDGTRSRTQEEGLFWLIVSEFGSPSRQGRQSGWVTCLSSKKELAGSVASSNQGTSGSSVQQSGRGTVILKGPLLWPCHSQGMWAVSRTGYTRYQLTQWMELSDKINLSY